MKIRNLLIISLLSAAALLGTVKIVRGQKQIVSADSVKSGYTAGEKYFGRKEYTEYIAGNLPLIISVPHGGHLKPAELPDRTPPVGRYDVNTQELARYIAEAVHEKTGRWPHMIINRLHRSKLDANRAIDRAACGNENTEIAFNEFHSFIDTAEADVVRNFGTGLYIDLHAHHHDKQSLELGYLLAKEDLASDDDDLNRNGAIFRSSIRHLAERSKMSFAELLRGEKSLGAMFEKKGYPAFPSPSCKDAGDDPYFDGGYNTEIHSSIIDGTIDGIQIETNYSDIRDSNSSMKAFAKAFADVIVDYLSVHFFNKENGNAINFSPAVKVK